MELMTPVFLFALVALLPQALVLLFDSAYTQSLNITEAWKQVLNLKELNDTFHGKFDAEPTADLFLLYTRRHRILPQVLVYDNETSVTSSSLNPNVPTVVLVHGWLENKYSPLSFTITNSLLRNSDVNVIVMDWSRLSRRDYITSTRGVPSVGLGLGMFLEFLNKATGMSYDSVHLVGFSLGAHVVGKAGRFLGGQIARITALDPAGPLWYFNDNSLRKSDAQFVEAIHTNAGEFGIYKAVGDVDFFPNGGSLQPGCDQRNVVCNHYRSIMLYASTLNTKRLVGRQCPNLVAFFSNLCFGQSLVMGNSDLRKHGSGVYKLTTGSVYPY